VRTAVVYVAGTQRPDHRQGSNSVAHLDPLCPLLARTYNSHARVAASPAQVSRDSATVGTIRLPLCRTCRTWQQPARQWRLWAACLPGRRDPALPADLWMRPDRRSRAIAREVCACCPVAAACFDYAVEQGLRHGTWGGRAGWELREAVAARRRGAA